MVGKSSPVYMNTVVEAEDIPILPAIASVVCILVIPPSVKVKIDFSFCDTFNIISLKFSSYFKTHIRAHKA